MRRKVIRAQLLDLGAFMKVIFAVLIGSIVSLAASANTHIICGKSIDWDNYAVKGYELELSSENDEYQGLVGNRWYLKLGSEDSEWIDSDPNISARTIESEDSDTVVEVIVKQAEAASGPVGYRYRLVNLFDDEPTLEKYSMGGFVGTLLLEKLKCMASYD